MSLFLKIVCSVMMASASLACGFALLLAATFRIKIIERLEKLPIAFLVVSLLSLTVMLISLIW